VTNEGEQGRLFGASKAQGMNGDASKHGDIAKGERLLGQAWWSRKKEGNGLHHSESDEHRLDVLLQALSAVSILANATPPGRFGM
jgi:hypothetical protein